MKNLSHAFYPQRVICLTEESVELFYDLGIEDRIIGASTFVRRPERAQELPVVTAFTHANLKKIINLRPDLVLGFSDIQKDIAKELIAAGLNVYITNQRSIAEILAYLVQVSALMGEQQRGLEYVSELKKKFDQCTTRGQQIKCRPRVYLEEWDEPMITGIKWFAELATTAGADVVFVKKSEGSLANQRFVSSQEVIASNPQIILACWCGKKVDLNAIKSRPGWDQIEAVQKDQVYELEPEIFLQPGPALFKDGLEILTQLFEKWSENQI